MSTIKNHRKLLTDACKINIYDVLVVGGGITGAGIARECGLQRLKTLVIDKGDFASGTSSKSSKLIHGGLRYLSYGKFKLVFESLAERYLLFTKIAPHIVKPIEFLVPVYKGAKSPRWLIAIGVYIYDILSLFRNYRRAKVLSTQELHQLEPEVKLENCSGAISYYDCTGLDFRLTIETLMSAREAGVHCLNYFELIEISESTEGTYIATLLDKLSNQVITTQTKCIINAGGTWADEISAKLGQEARFNLKMTRGIHLVVDQKRLPIKRCVGVESYIDQRGVYAIPWEDKVLLGTTDTWFSGDKDEIDINSKDIDYLLSSISFIFPDLHLSRADVLCAYAGIRPLIGSDKNQKESSLPRDFSIYLAKNKHFASITGGKLTTYRVMAKELVKEVMRRYFSNKSYAKNLTAAPLPGSKTPITVEGLYTQTQVNALSKNSCQYLLGAYGDNALKVVAYGVNKPELLRPLHPDCNFIGAEVPYLIYEEFVCRLSDVFMRRTTLFMFSTDNGEQIVLEVAKIMAHYLNWDERQIAHECNHYLAEIGKMRRAIAY